MKKKKQICCNLCNIQFPCDELSSKRMKRHSDFHNLALIQKRNTVQGIPKYSITYSETELHG